MKKSGQQASSLRIILAILIVLIFLGSIVEFYFAKQYITDAAIKYNQSTAATNSTSYRSAAKKLQNDITQYQPVADKATTVFVSSQDYQSKMIGDLKKYAANDNITISNYTFDKTAASVNVVIANPVKFTNLIKFIKEIETNTPKMQLNGIDISSVQNNNGYVTVKPLTIKAYTK